MELNQKIKSLLKLITELELYEVTINGCLERLEKDMEKLKTDNLHSFKIAVSPDNTEHDNLIIGLAETVETIFLKSRNLLTKFPLDTVAQERLETLGVNFDIDTGTIVELDNLNQKEIN